MSHVNVLLIQGVFFFAQRGKKYLLESHHFSGVIFPTGDIPARLSGRLVDKFGNSSLTNITVAEDELKFTKTYPRQQKITHVLRKSSRHPDIWVGKFKGKKVGEGRVHCLITSVSSDFLNPCL